MPGKHQDRDKRNRWRRADYAKRKASAIDAGRKPIELRCSHCGGVLLLDRNTMALIEDRTEAEASAFDVELAGTMKYVRKRQEF